MTERVECLNREVWEFVRLCVMLRDTSDSDEESLQVTALEWLSSIEPEADADHG
jgi:hypothetical protein